MIVLVLIAAFTAAVVAGGRTPRQFNYTRATVAGLAVLLIASMVLTGDAFAILDQVTSRGPSITEYP